MNWDEMKNVWEQQPVPELKLSDPVACEREFTQRQHKAERMLFWRDVREAGAGAFVSGVLAYCGWQMGPAGWPIAFSVLLVLAVSAFFVRERFRVRRQTPPMDAPLLVRLDAAIAEQERQRQLLLGIARWYLGPVLLAGVIFGATVLWNAPLPKLPLVLAAGFTAAILAVCAWLVLAINRRAVRQSIEPQLHSLRQLRSVLVESG